MQLDEAERGFSFRLDGPLDMRMGGDGPSAADVVARAVRARSRRHHRHARRGAPARARRARHRHGARTRRRSRPRARSPTSSRASCARSRATIHPATRTFQALRIFVNDELDELARGARRRRAHPQAGRPAGRGRPSIRSKTASSRRSSPSAAGRAAGSRHRAGGRRRRRRPSGCSPSGRSSPDDAEIAANPRARSAKLRAAERTDAPPRADAVEPLLPRCRRSPTSCGGADDRALLNICRDRARWSLAAAYVYKIKFESTRAGRARRQAARARSGASATPSPALRAEWAKLDNPRAHPGAGAAPSAR